MDIYHPDMAALQQHLQQNRQERELRHAIETGRQLESAAKQQNLQHDLQRQAEAARQAGA